MIVPFATPSHWIRRAAQALAFTISLCAGAGAIAAPAYDSKSARDAQPNGRALGQPSCGNSQALGTSRIARIGTDGGLAVGLKTYWRCPDRERPMWSARGTLRFAASEAQRAREMGTR